MVEIQVDSKEATRPEVQNQCPKRQRQPPIRYGQGEFTDTVAEGVLHAAYNVSQIMESKTMEETLQVIMVKSGRMQQTQNLTHLWQMKHGNWLSYPVATNQ